PRVVHCLHWALLLRRPLKRCVAPCSPALPRYSFFFFNAAATTEIYTLSLHDALPIFTRVSTRGRRRCRWRRPPVAARRSRVAAADRKSTRLNSSHVEISYAVFCLKKKKQNLSVSIIAGSLSRPPA